MAIEMKVLLTKNACTVIRQPKVIMGKDIYIERERRTCEAAIAKTIK